MNIYGEILISINYSLVILMVHWTNNVNENHYHFAVQAYHHAY